MPRTRSGTARRKMTFNPYNVRSGIQKSIVFCQNYGKLICSQYRSPMSLTEIALNFRELPSTYSAANRNSVLFRLNDLWMV